MRASASLILAVLAVAGPARADSWSAAVASGVASPNGNYVVRVLPGESLGDVVGFAGSKKGRYAKAIYYRLQADNGYGKYLEVELLNPIAPVYVAVSNAGELVTLDNWHNVGFGKVVAVYAPDGRVRRSYSLADLYSAEELGKVRRSVSSIWWRCPHAPRLDERASTLELADALGNSIGINLGTGAIVKKPSGQKC
jgi:hypothetical protein